MLRITLYLVLSYAWLIGSAFGDTNEAASKPKAGADVIMPPPTLDEIEAWIADLNAPEFSKRETATRQLTMAGLAAVEPLRKAAAEAKLEATVRITAILRSWFTSENADLAERAEAVLEDLVTSKHRHQAARALTVLEQHDDIREERALAHVRRLGGIVKLTETTAGGGVQFVPPRGADYFVILGRDWQGGRDGLKYVRRLSSLTTVYLLRDHKTAQILTPGVSKEDVAELERAMPQLKVQYRGPAVLGIQPTDRFAGCVVRVVAPGSPAEKAKILVNDVIVQFDGKPVGSFDDLVDLIAQKKPGDAVKVEVLRGDESDLRAYERLQSLKDPEPATKQVLDELRKRLAHSIEVTLGEWRGN